MGGWDLFKGWSIEEGLLLSRGMTSGKEDENGSRDSVFVDLQKASPSPGRDCACSEVCSGSSSSRSLSHLVSFHILRSISFPDNIHPGPVWSYLKPPCLLIPTVSETKSKTPHKAKSFAVTPMKRIILLLLLRCSCRRDSAAAISIKDVFPLVRSTLLLEFCIVWSA